MLPSSCDSICPVFDIVANHHFSDDQRVNMCGSARGVTVWGLVAMLPRRRHVRSQFIRALGSAG
jgi:hypothetical protein